MINEISMATASKTPTPIHIVITESEESPYSSSTLPKVTAFTVIYPIQPQNS